MEPDDGELLRRVRAGEAQAFAMIVERYEDRLVSYVSNIGLFEEAADIAQETFIQLYQGKRRYGEIENLWKYLLGIATYLANSERRRGYRWIALLPSLIAGLPTVSPQPDARLRSKEVRREVNAALGKLPPKLRHALGLYEIEGLTYEEIADLTNCSMGTVASRISCARKRMRFQLADWWIGARHDGRTDLLGVEEPAPQESPT
jgi:RNA polymerase sigma-70 factor, ECF subfamily